MTEDRMAILEQCGVRFIHAKHYEGEPPNRHPVEDPQISSVHLGLSPEDWCLIAQREGQMYVGGCCANMSALQDYINAAFRDSGVVSASDFGTIAGYAIDHDGFEGFEENFWTEDLFNTFTRRWKGEEPLPTRTFLDPWLKIGLIWATVKDKLQAERFEAPRAPREPGKADFSLVVNTLYALRWRDLFDRQEDEIPQHEANRQLALARLLEPLDRVREAAYEQFQGFRGWALVDPATLEPLENMRGRCIYTTQAAAQRTIDLWLKGSEPPDFALREIEVTKDGLTVL